MTKLTRVLAVSLFFAALVSPLIAPLTEVLAAPALFSAPLPNSQSLQPPQIHAQAAALIDVQSGRILYSKQGDQTMLIASLTKIMTALVAIEHGNLADQVTISKNAVGVEGSSIYLELGQKMSLQDLLYGLMLRSGNDAAVAVAEHVGGSVDGFVHLMNEQAEMLGMSHSHFANPHGLDQTGHYSTANDMAVLTAYALRNAQFREIVKTKRKTVPDPDDPWDYTWFNKNKMLSIYEGADGVKTGYTKKSRRCLVSSATRNGMQLAVVTLNDPDDWADHTLLLNYGFEQFHTQQLAAKNQLIPTVSLVAGRSFYYPLTEEELQQIDKKVALVSEGSIDGRLGEKGMLMFYLNKNLIGRVPLYEQGSPLLSASNSPPPAYLDNNKLFRERYGYIETLKSLVIGLFTRIS